MLCFFLLVPLLILVSQEEGLTNLKPTTKKTETSHNPQPKTKANLTFPSQEKKSVRKYANLAEIPPFCNPLSVKELAERRNFSGGNRTQKQCFYCMKAKRLGHESRGFTVQTLWFHPSISRLSPRAGEFTPFSSSFLSR